MSSFVKLELAGIALCSAMLLSTPRAVRADEGEKVFHDACSACHDAKTRPLDKLRLTRAQWKEAVERMEGLGAEIPSGKKLDALLDHLERTHGPDGASTPEKK